MTCSPSDDEIERVSKAWLAFQVTRDSEHEWSVATWDSWLEVGDYAAMSRFVLQLCRDVAPDDHKAIAMIGAAPLEDLIQRWEDAGISLVEAEAENNPILLEALDSVWLRSETSRERITALRAAREATGE
jgi:hypothetical protein